jgi:hypothetical protein
MLRSRRPQLFSKPIDPQHLACAIFVDHETTIYMMADPSGISLLPAGKKEGEIIRAELLYGTLEVDTNNAYESSTSSARLLGFMM